MSAHVVEIDRVEVFWGSSAVSRAVAGLPVVDADYAALRIYAATPLSRIQLLLALDLITDALASTARIPARMRFARLEFAQHADVPTHRLRVMLLPVNHTERSAPHPSPLPQGEREIRDGGDLTAAPLPQGGRVAWRRKWQVQS